MQSISNTSLSLKYNVLFRGNCKTKSKEQCEDHIQRYQLHTIFLVSERKSVTKCLFYLCITIPYVELQKRKLLA